MFAFVPCIVAPVLYGASIFIIKEEDMALTARTHKAPPGAYHHVAHQHNMQAQLIWSLPPVLVIPKLYCLVSSFISRQTDFFFPLSSRSFLSNRSLSQTR